jgi:hypothetical protein
VGSKQRPSSVDSHPPGLQMTALLMEPEGSGTMLQAGRSQVRFLMVVFYLILPVAL